MHGTGTLSSGHDIMTVDKTNVRNVGLAYIYIYIYIYIYSRCGEIQALDT